MRKSARQEVRPIHSIRLALGVTVAAVLSVNALWLKCGFLGLGLVALCFALIGLLSRHWLERDPQASDGLLGVFLSFASITLVGGVAALLGIFNVYIGPVLLGSFLIALSLRNYFRPGVHGQSETPKIPRRLPEFMMLVGFACLVLAAFWTLFAARTGARLDSVWDATPSYFWVLILASLLLLWGIVRDHRFSPSLRLLCIIAFGLIFYSLTGVVYSYGYGVDIYLHAAHQANLLQSGSIGGLQTAFIHPGFEALITVVWTLTGTQQGWELYLTIFLPAILAGLFVPYFAYKLGGMLTTKENALRISLLSLAFPSVLFVTFEQPRVLAAVFLFGAILPCISLSGSKKYVIGFGIFFATTIALIHPLLGIVALPALFSLAIPSLTRARGLTRVVPSVLRFSPGLLTLLVLPVFIPSRGFLENLSGISLPMPSSQVNLASLAAFLPEVVGTLLPVGNNFLDNLGTGYIYVMPILGGTLALLGMKRNLPSNVTNPYFRRMSIVSWNLMLGSIGLYLSFFMITNPPILTYQLYLLLHPVVAFASLPWLGDLV